MMKNEIINKVIEEFEHQIKYWHDAMFEISTLATTNEWDHESAFHYSEENGVSEFLKNEGNKEVSEVIEKGNRTFIIFEYRRKTAPNLPARKIYMGEIIKVDSKIHIKGCSVSFSSYVNGEKAKFLEMIDNVMCLDELKRKLVKQCADFHCL